MEQLDPRLIEIEILSEADRAFVRGDASYQYTKANPSGARDRQRDEALQGLMMDCAIVSTSTSYNGAHVQEHPTRQLEHAASVGISELLSGGRSILNLRITQAGRLRLFRLRDEILQRDRIRDAFAGLWVKQHFLPDLTVKLRIRDLEKPISLIVIDVDNLRAINAELGHHGADQVLTGIFEILRDVVRPYEAYRLGGDEAGVILPEVPLDRAEKLGEEIRALIAGRAWEGLAIKTKPTVSIGVGTGTSAGQIEPQAFYAAVDALAIRAKKSGKNKVISAEVPAPPSSSAGRDGAGS